MKLSIALCAGGLAIAMLGSAQAQVYGGPPRYYEPPPGYGPPARVYLQPRSRFYGARPPMMVDGLSPREILARVRAAGMRPLTQPARRGQRYVLMATDQVGAQFHVVVNGFSGQIVRVISTDDPRFASRGGPPRALKDPPATARNVPAIPPPATARNARIAPPTANTKDDQRLASAPSGTEASAPPRPRHTPLPRRRPATASTEAAPATEGSAAAPAEPAQQPTATPAPAVAQTAAPARPAAETPIVPVAPLE